MKLILGCLMMLLTLSLAAQQTQDTKTEPKAEPSAQTQAAKAVQEKAPKPISKMDALRNKVIDDPSSSDAWKALIKAHRKEKQRLALTHRSKPKNPPHWEDVARRGMPELGADASCWVMYTKAHDEMQKDGDGTPFARELEASEAALMTLTTPVKGPDLKLVPVAPERKRPFWAVMDRANKAGLLKEAIYILMMNDSLKPEYQKYKTDHHDQLLAFLKMLVKE